MDRSLRRHHARRIKVRHARRLWDIEGDWIWRYQLEGWNQTRNKIWWPWFKLTMRGYPKQWDVDFHIRPARIRSNQLLHLIERGVPDDLLHFPDYRKPHIYYW
jgi:hypothetical protein